MPLNLRTFTFRFLLSYGNRPAELRLIASGIGDIDELRSHIRAEDICFGLFREPSGDQSRRLALNYIPNSIKGVHRGRHQCFLSAMFKLFIVIFASSPCIGPWQGCREQVYSELC